MPKITFLTLTLCLSLLATAVRGAEWSTDFEKALATAKASNKHLLLDFTGSDWCGPCIQMKKTVFSKPAFITYADQNLVLVEIDFPMRKSQSDKVKKQNARLEKQFKVDGYPTIVLLDPDGKMLGQLDGYDGEKPADMIAWVEKTKRGKK